MSSEQHIGYENSINLTNRVHMVQIACNVIFIFRSLFNFCILET